MKHFLLKTWLILVCLLTGAGTMWAEEVTYVMKSYDSTNKVYTATDDQNGVWSLSTNCSTSNQLPADFSQTGASSRGICFGTPSNVTVTSQTSFTNVTKIVVEASSNIGSGTGTLEIKVGTTSLGSKNLSKTNHTTYEFTSATPLSGVITLTANQGKNSVWIGGFKVTTSAGGSTPTPTALSVPTNLSSSNVTTTGATLSWDAVSNASSYTVKIGTTEYTNATSPYSATGLTAGTQYTWTVKAVGDGVSYSTSEYAANANFTTEAEQGGGDEPSGDSKTASFIFNTDAGLSALGITKPASNKGTSLGDKAYTSGPISMTATNGTTETRVWSSTPTTLRVYAGNSTTAPGTLTFSGTTIKQIVFNGTVPMTANVGTFSEKTWTGEATSVTFTATGSVTINTIEVTYKESDTPTKPIPTLSFANLTYNATMGEGFEAPTLNNPQEVIVSYSSSAEGVATINATTGEVSLVAPGMTTITASFAGDENYNKASASYELVVAPAPAPALTTMDAIYAAAKAAGSTATDCRITFSNWVVSGLNGTKNAYLTDNNGKGLIIFDNGSAHGFATGDVLNGTATCKIQLFNGSAEITSLASTTEGLTVTKGGSVSEQTITIADLAGVNTGALVAYEGLTYHLNGTSAEFSDGENVIVAYKGIMNALPELVEGKTYDIKGIFLMYGTKKEILPRSEDDIVLKENLNKYVVTIETPENGTLTVKDGETVINDGDEVAEGTELTIECTPANEDYRFVNWQYKAESMDAFATRTKDFTYTMPSANVQFKATFEEIPVYTVTYMSLGSPAGTEQVKEGNKIANAPSVSLTDWTFVGWTTNGSYTDSETAPALFDDAITEATTLYAVFSQGENGAAGSASLTNDEICNKLTGSYADGFITNTYGTWNYNAAKQGNVSKDGEYFLQLRNNATISYLQIPEMAGNITSIVLGRVCNTSKEQYTGSIYFRSEKSNDATAIATTTQSTALTDVTLTIPDGYKTGYVMVSGACRIESVTVNYTTGGNKTYTITGPLPDGGTINFVATTGDGKYYATFSSTRGVKFDEVFVNDAETCMASVKAYAVAVIDGQILKTSLTEDYNDGNYTYIPANTGVLFEYVLEDGYTFDGAVPFEYADAETEYLDPVEDNMLVACPTTGACPTVEGTNYYYKLAYGDNTNKTKLGFWWGAADGSSNFKVKAGGAVLVVPQTTGSNMRGFSFGGEDTLTSIHSITNSVVTGEIYNLQGQRINRLLQGVNIVNGRKVIR